MILTGKALEHFENWYWNEWFSDKERNHYNKNIHEAVRALHTTDKVFLYALIIEFFDSIKHNEIWSLWDFSFKKIFHTNVHLSVLEVQKEAIIKAKEIFNERSVK